MSLKIEKWYLFGGSWGSTLALLYGIDFPNRCLGFILRGIFLGCKIEIDWFLYDIKKFFPEAYEKFISLVPKNHRNNILGWFHSQLHNNNRSQNLKAASAWLNTKILAPHLIILHVQYLVSRLLQYQK